ncbi:hypothetical protein MXAN_6675 [Myxococcus xanthus DK 1622]|uniref:Transposase TnpC homeodomain domain-containing protein n=1 Tax=Myxococcus xanthus (strain DK1622) TaxID=246197 RepID=Q1CXT1_MYXXD|nr:hypothetical protein MXAN_6675 [Myxococcus xanthus DK 1622]
MPRELPQDRFCPWREEAEDLKARLTSLEAKMATLERHVFRRRAEKLPTVADELREDGGRSAAPGGPPLGESGGWQSQTHSRDNGSLAARPRAP